WRVAAHRLRRRRSRSDAPHSGRCSLVSTVSMANSTVADRPFDAARWDACTWCRSCGMLSRMRRSLLPADVERYVSTEITPESPLQRRLRDETAKLPMGLMQISADQGALLALLVRMLDARHAIEIGTFTGYSALAV